MSDSEDQPAPPPEAQVISKTPLPDAVLELQRSIVNLEAAVAMLSERKSVAANTKHDAKLLVAAGGRISASIVAACKAKQNPRELHVLAKSYVAVACESTEEWTNVVQERAESSTLKSVAWRADTASQLHAFSLSMQVLEEMLGIDNGVARLVLDPTHHLGLAQAKPSADLPILSTSRALYEGFKVVLQGLGNMTDGAPWPWKAIPQTILQFASMVERALSQHQAIHDLTDKIGRRVALLLGVSHNKSGSNTELDSYVECFLADVQRIIIRLRIIERVHPAKAFPLTEYIDNMITGEMEKMQEALQELQTRFTVNTAYTAQNIADGVAALQDTVSQTHDIAAETRADVKVITSAVAASALSLDATQVLVSEIHASITGSRNKQSPNMCAVFSRSCTLTHAQSYIEEIVALICELFAAHIAIMGSGGMGKTALALAILHDERVVEVLGDSRFFISVEGFIDADSASKQLAKHLGLAESADPLSAAIAYLESLPRALLVVDNLETLWFSNNAAERINTERFLSRLADISSLALLLTSRGAVPPSGILWSNAQSAELAPISLDAARATFGQIANMPSDSVESAALDTLLGEMDCIPLAVTLLSRLAQLKNLPSELLRRWKKSHTMILRGQGNHREHNVNVSITVSDVQSLRKFIDHFEDIDAAKDLLIEFALVSVGPEGEIKMLSPIRHFVRGNHPMTADHSAVLRRVYFKIAASAPQRPADDFASRSEAFAPEYANLNSFLLHLIDSEQPSKKLVEAVEAVSEHAYWTVPSSTLREALLPRLAANANWRARCLHGMGRTRMQRDEYSLAAEDLRAARTLYAELGNRLQEAHCRRRLGECLQLQNLFSAAEKELLVARDMYISVGSEIEAASCTRGLGKICQGRHEYDQAVALLSSARATFEQHGRRLHAAQCILSLGRVHLEQNDVSAAESDFQFALSEFEALGVQSSAAGCTKYLGDVRRLQKNLDRRRYC
ncbi:hypothetical protein BKA62DRAFT_806464 [Auriculariales sp. MPI-PUGE-AT-0066]|nr:hypothetical protein BKA62DRAFT_806464 [Auriculariales sp. MPI-PUGE-AT-0066]